METLIKMYELTVYFSLFADFTPNIPEHIDIRISHLTAVAFHNQGKQQLVSEASDMRVIYSPSY